MGALIDIGGNGKASSREVSSCNLYAKELEDELMKYTADFEENNSDVDSIDETQKVDRESEPRITGQAESSANEVVKECLDDTESSSSFGDSDYGVGSAGEGIESEVSSAILAHAASVLDFDGVGEVIRNRNKKMTDHWRVYIQPLMWRCKWVELQIRKLESIAQAYERKLEACNQRAQRESMKSTLYDLGAPRSDCRTKAFRRKKRRRAESTMDIAEYMAHHNLFSYYDNRKLCTDNRVRFAQAASRDNELKKPETTQEANVVQELWGDNKVSCAGDPDSFQEHIFCKIENLQSQVRQLKSRIKERSEKAEQLRCSNNPSMPIERNCLPVSPPNSASPSEDSDEMTIATYIASQLMAEFNMGSDALGYEDILLDENGFQNHAYLPEAFGDGYEEVLIDNHRMVDEMKIYERLKIEPTQSPALQENGLKSAYPPVYKPDLPYNCKLPPKVPLISRLSAAPRSMSRKRKQRVSPMSRSNHLSINSRCNVNEERLS